jgi:hypothetical protein
MSGSDPFPSPLVMPVQFPTPMLGEYVETINFWLIIEKSHLKISRSWIWLDKVKVKRYLPVSIVRTVLIVPYGADALILEGLTKNLFLTRGMP